MESLADSRRLSLAEWTDRIERAVSRDAGIAAYLCPAPDPFEAGARLLQRPAVHADFQHAVRLAEPERYPARHHRHAVVGVAGLYAQVHLVAGSRSAATAAARACAGPAAQLDAARATVRCRRAVGNFRQRSEAERAACRDAGLVAGPLRGDPGHRDRRLAHRVRADARTGHH